MYNVYSFDFKRDLKLYLCPVCPVWSFIPIPFLYGMISHCHVSSSGPGSNLSSLYLSQMHQFNSKTKSTIPQPLTSWSLTLQLLSFSQRRLNYCKIWATGRKVLTQKIVKARAWICTYIYSYCFKHCTEGAKPVRNTKPKFYILTPNV